MLQGVEKYNKGIIIYSLGNFQFEIEKEDIELTQYTNILELLIDKDDVQVKKTPYFYFKEWKSYIKVGKRNRRKVYANKEKM